MRQRQDIVVVSAERLRGADGLFQPGFVGRGAEVFHGNSSQKIVMDDVGAQKDLYDNVVFSGAHSTTHCRTERRGSSAEVVKKIIKAIASILITLFFTPVGFSHHQQKIT